MDSYNIIYNGISDYIFDNSVYESENVINSVNSLIKSAGSIEEIFKIPIDNRIFNFEESLNWTFFLFTTSKIIESKKIDFNYNFNLFVAMNYIHNIFNIKREKYESYFYPE